MNPKKLWHAMASLTAIFLIVCSQTVSADVVIFESMILDAKGNNNAIDSIQNNAPVTTFPTVFDYEVSSGGAKANFQSTYSQDTTATTFSYGFDFIREAGPNSYIYLLALPSFQTSTPMTFELTASMEIEGTPNFILLNVSLRSQSDQGIFWYGGELENTVHDQFGFDAAGNYFDYDGFVVFGSPTGVLFPDLYIIQSEIGVGAFDSTIEIPARARGNITFRLTAVPEPSSMVLLSLVCCMFFVKRQQRP